MAVSWGVKRALASPATDLVVWACWLLLVAASLTLPIYLGASLLSARHCTPSYSLTLEAGLLSSLDPSAMLAAPDPEAPPGPSLLETFLDPEVHLHLLHTNTSTNVSVQVSTHSKDMPMS